MKSAGKNSALFGFWLLLILSAAQFLSPAIAERLAIKTYTSDDGLGSSFINHIARDSRGFMWFCTFHFRHIFEKLQVHSKSEAVVKALRDRLV